MRTVPALKSGRKAFQQVIQFQRVESHLVIRRAQWRLASPARRPTEREQDASEARTPNFGDRSWLGPMRAPSKLHGIMGALALY